MMLKPTSPPSFPPSPGRVRNEPSNAAAIPLLWLSPERLSQNLAVDLASRRQRAERPQVLKSSSSSLLPPNSSSISSSFGDKICNKATLSHQLMDPLSFPVNLTSISRRKATAEPL